MLSALPRTKGWIRPWESQTNNAATPAVESTLNAEAAIHIDDEQEEAIADYMNS